MQNFGNARSEAPVNARERDRDKEPAFRVRVALDLDFDLAEALGNHILDSHCENKAIVALAWRLVGKS